ncbi:Haloacid dehalogenase [Pleurostoma richardsiae]|uniref:Haloacid dehalogenase n=1 Tax=Pleurostoma richardsiae TaxID=41990 RepID=A0AA38VWD7_9PEZI|nr:Haloacid dehalogenase [Pleurostoma richardsiae]
MAVNKTLQDQIRALTFDVFGTVVDWRSSVEAALKREIHRKIDASSFTSLSPELQERVGSLTDKDLATFAQEWRDSYGVFTKGFVPGVTPWKDVDTHHYDSLVDLLDKWQLKGLLSQEETRALSLVWHRLAPWPDSSEGLHLLGTKLSTATLSNGNQSLLRDLNERGDLGFQKLISAEDFRAYKPNPSTYLGAAKALGVEPGELAMVAAHLGDLQAARGCGLRTIYVERPAEEAWGKDDERYAAAKEWVDIWVREGEGGFIEVARRLGLP